MTTARRRRRKCGQSSGVTAVKNGGFALVSSLRSAEECADLIAALGESDTAGRRGILGVDTVSRFARSSKVMGLIRPLLSGEPRAVRGIFFDKSPALNWVVAWHQDLTIAVRERRDVPDFGPWSVKAGVTHVQPPVGLLEQMITVRIHLDDADEANGALRVIPGSHRRGRLDAAAIEQTRSVVPESVCAAAVGDALLMRPLLLHASGRSVSKRRRRVLHIDYAGFSLPGGLEWNEQD